MSAYGVGCVDRVDAVEHAIVVHRLTAGTALCGAGRIVLSVDGDFQPSERSACPLCALMVVEEAGELGPAIDRLTQEFPDVPRDVVVSVLSDSYRSVVGWTERPLVDKAEDLTRLRLEVRTRHPALRAGDAGRRSAV